MPPLEQLAQKTTEILSKVLPGVPDLREKRFAYRRSGGGISGRWEEDPAPVRGLWRVDWGNFISELDPLLCAVHPLLPCRIGTDLSGYRDIFGGRWFLESCARRVLTLGARDRILTVVSALLDEAYSLAHGKAPLRVRIIAPTPSVAGRIGTCAELANGVVFRELNDDELIDVYATGVARTDERVATWGFVGTVDLPLLLGESSEDSSYAPWFRAPVEGASLACRIAHGAPVDHDRIVAVYPETLFTGGSSHLSLTRRLTTAQQIQPEELKEAQRLAPLLSQSKHASLDVAIGRLSTALDRSDVRDQVIDSVIGLEAILLASSGGPQYRGELRFRFALNYGVLHPTPIERHRAFLLARDAYDLRSRLAHGGLVGETVRLGSGELPLPAAAGLLIGLLRDLVVRFLPTGSAPDFARPSFWEDQYFGSPRSGGLDTSLLSS